MRSKTNYYCDKCSKQFDSAEACEDHEFVCKRKKLPDWIKPGVLAFDLFSKRIIRVLAIDIDHGKVAIQHWWDMDTDPDYVWQDYERIQSVIEYYRELVIDRHSPSTIKPGTKVSLVDNNGHYTISRVDLDGTVVMYYDTDQDLEVRVPVKALHRLVGEEPNGVYKPFAAAVGYKNYSGNIIPVDDTGAAEDE